MRASLALVPIMLTHLDRHGRACPGHPRLATGQRRDRGRESVTSPSLRTGLADFPHPALQLVVLPPRGLAGQGMSFLQAKEPMLGKEGIGPALMIGAVNFGHPFVAETFAQEASQPPADPAVHQSECRAMAVLEVLEPSSQGAVHVRDDHGKALSRGSFGLGADRILELRQALLARPATARLEVIAEEVKAVFLRVHQPRLGRMQRQPGLRRPSLHLGQGIGRFLRAATQDHEVVCISHHLEPALGHQMVEPIEIDVAQQRAHHSTLRCPLFGSPFPVTVQYALLEERLDQRQDTTVCYFLADQGQQAVLGNRVEVALQIGIDDMEVTVLEQLLDPPQRVLATLSGPETVAVRSKVSLEYWLQHHAKRRLYHPVTDRWYSQRTLLLTSRFGNVVPSDLLRSIRSTPQLLAQALQVGVQITRVLCDRDMIHPGGTLVGLYAHKGRTQRVLGMKLVDQAVPFAAFDPLLEGRQHPLRPDLWFDPRPFGRAVRPLGLSDALTPRLHRGDCHRFLSVSSGHRVSTFLHPFAPPALPGFIATMGALTPARRVRRSDLPPSCAGQVSLLHAPGHREPSVSNHRTAPPAALTPILSADGLPLARVWASPLHRRLASRSGRIEFAHATDDPLVFHCSPRRLAADAVTVDYRPWGQPEGDLHPSDQTYSQAHDARHKAGHDAEGSTRPGHAVVSVHFADCISEFAEKVVCLII